VPSAVCVWGRGTIFNRLSAWIAKAIRYDMTYFLLHKDVAFFDKHKTGDILSRMGSDVTIIQDGLSSNISMFLRALSFIIVTLIILFAKSPQLTLVTLAGICPVILAAGCFGAYYRRISKEIQAAIAELGQISEEAISNVRTVKAFANEAEEVAKFRKANQVAYELGVKSGIAAGAFSFGVSFGMNGCLAGVMYYGAKLSKDGTMGAGPLSAYLLYMI